MRTTWKSNKLKIMSTSENNNNSDETEQPNLQKSSAENEKNRSATPPDVVGDSTPGAIADGETLTRDITEGRLSCFIGNGTSLTGELSFRQMARVDGHITGKVKSEKGTLIIGPSGQVDASVWVATAVINGTVNGDITTSEHLELKRTAKIVGNIRTPRLIMEDGAILEGNCSMLKAEEKSEIRQTKQFAPPTGATTANPATANAAAASVGTAANATAAKSNQILTRDNQLRDSKKPFETVGKNEESSKLTLEVI